MLGIWLVTNPLTEIDAFKSFLAPEISIKPLFKPLLFSFRKARHRAEFPENSPPVNCSLAIALIFLGFSSKQTCSICLFNGLFLL